MSDKLLINLFGLTIAPTSPSSRRSSLSWLLLQGRDRPTAARARYGLSRYEPDPLRDCPGRGEASADVRFSAHNGPVGRHLRFVPILPKSFWVANEILEPLMRFMRDDGGTISFHPKSIRTSVVALKSAAAAEKSKDQLSRDFPGRRFHLQQYRPEGDIVFRPLRAATAFTALQDHLLLRAAFQMSNCF